MFVPTIKYKKVNAENDRTTLEDNSIAPSNPSIQQLAIKQQEQQRQSNTYDSPTPANNSSITSSQTLNELTISTPISRSDEDTNTIVTEGITFEEKDDATIIVDPSDDERILITLSDGKTQYTADRYCPHAGADLSYLGQVDEDEYPPEIGPILLCTLHYWEFALKRAGRSANGVATINVCPFAAAAGNGDGGDGSSSVTCQVKKKLDW